MWPRWVELSGLEGGVDWVGSTISEYGFCVKGSAASCWRWTDWPMFL